MGSTRLDCSQPLSGFRFIIGLRERCSRAGCCEVGERYPNAARPCGQMLSVLFFGGDFLRNADYESWVVPAGVPSALADIGGRV